MPEYIGRVSAALAMTVLLAACGGEQKAASTDSANLQMAPAASTSQPALSDTTQAPAPAPAPATRRRTPVATVPSTADRPRVGAIRTQPARPAGGEVAAGTSLLLHPDQRVCTNTYKVGDLVSATVAETAAGSNGVSIPAGATVHMQITALKRSENAKDPIDMGFDAKSVTIDGRTYVVSATVTAETIERVRNEPTSKDVQKVVGGALIGAIVGKLLGKSNKGAVIGGAAGAAAGGAVAATTANFEGCIAQGSNMTVRLNAPVVIQ
ncbi:MAG: hypothetical protein B7Z72_00610 [Gemmatimonadetes bacterium 21-71-4]|nr:MAG: hypothetical protein B7Z72_00610 [Gemmatimonadetes bacterium 21-71-4]